MCPLYPRGVSDLCEAVVQRALGLGWQVRRHADQMRLLLPQLLSLREIVDALEGTKVSAVNVLPVTLDDVYLELMDEGLTPSSTI